MICHLSCAKIPLILTAPTPATYAPLSPQRIGIFSLLYYSSLVREYDSLVHTRYGPWPGFRYIESEQQEMKALDASVPTKEFFTWLGLVTVFAIAAFAVVVILGMMGLLAVIGGDEHMKDTPATLFFFTLFYFEVPLLASCCVLPVVMVICSGIIGRFYRIVALNFLPDRATTGRLFRKVWFQIVRMTLILSGLALLYWLFVPVGSKLDLLVRFIAPMLAPLVTTLSTGWLLAGRLGR